ncbi:hypothetical protein EDC96DRAFT_611649 [Choanephora cucurbitarum]|nr:hypothetical protein EDC96DRAFT_611649 [Choanephora cucurbitarum]
MATVSFLKMSKRACHSCQNDKDSSSSSELPSIALPETLPGNHNDCKSHSSGSEQESDPAILSELGETLEELQQTTVDAAAGIKPAASSPCGSCDSESSSHAPPHEDVNDENVAPTQDDALAHDEAPAQDDASTQDDALAHDEAPAQDDASTQDDALAHDETPAQDDASTQDDAPAQDEAPVQVEVPIHAKSPRGKKCPHHCEEEEEEEEKEVDEKDCD